MLGYPLKFTRAILQAMGAIHRVTGQEQFQSSAGQPQCLFTSGANHHPLCYGNSTGRNWLILTFNLHKAETTGSERLAPLPNSTKVRDIDVIVQSRPQNLSPGGSSYFLAVNRQRDFFDFGQYSRPLFSPQGRGHFRLGVTLLTLFTSFRRVLVPCRSSYQRLPFGMPGRSWCPASG
jgi:hypothetical protein